MIDKVIEKLFCLKEKYDKLQLNIVGGEHLISGQMNYIISKANNIGYGVSLITNGYLMKNSYVILDPYGRFFQHNEK